MMGSTLFKRTSALLKRPCIQLLRLKTNGDTKKKFWSSNRIYVALAASAAITYFFYNRKALKTIHEIQKSKDYDRIIKLTSREKRFIQFASVEYDGQIYMTPQDFLESVIALEARPRLKRTKLSEADMVKILMKTPGVGSTINKKLFRTLGEDGVISYTEYLFLLSVVTKPIYSFRIAFDMFDRDLSGEIDREEFAVIERVFAKVWKGRRKIPHFEESCKRITEAKHFLDCNQYGQQGSVNTTLVLHFFGLDSANKLSFPAFETFLNGLQSEMLEYEFSGYSKGLNYITEKDFAQILLKYTYLEEQEFDRFMDSLMMRLTHNKGISFVEFSNFCTFLNFLEDFKLTLKMYIKADYNVSKEEFNRAIKVSTGKKASEHLVDTVFEIFDIDNDGILSSREYLHFISVMTDRLHRGLKMYTKTTGWDGFTRCVKFEVKHHQQIYG